MAATVAQILQRAYENYARILVLLTQAIAEPNRADIDAIVTAADAAGVMRPKPTYTVDGENYAWTEYQQFIVTQMEQLHKLIVKAGGPYEVRTLGKV